MYQKFIAEQELETITKNKINNKFILFRNI